MARTKRSGADQKKKRSDTLRKIANALKIRKLQSKNKRGRVTSTTSKKMSNITGDTANKLRAESVYSTVKTKGGMSNLGKDYKKSEKELSKFATEDSAQRNKAKYPKMGTYKNKDGKSYADEKKKSKSKSDLKVGKYFTWKGKMYKAGSVGARRAENQMRARKRAQEAAKKRLANK